MNCDNYYERDVIIITYQCSIFTVVLVPETTRNPAGLPDAAKTSV